MAVLEGATKTIKNYTPIILMEFNSWCLTAYSRINPIDFAEWIFRHFKFVYIVDRTKPYIHLRRLASGDATAFVHANMVSGCVDDLVVANNDKHASVIEHIIKGQSLADEASTQSNNTNQRTKNRYGITGLIKQIKDAIY